MSVDSGPGIAAVTGANPAPGPLTMEQKMDQMMAVLQQQAQQLALVTQQSAALANRSEAAEKAFQMVSQRATHLESQLKTQAEAQAASSQGPSGVCGLIPRR